MRDQHDDDPFDALRTRSAERRDLLEVERHWRALAEPGSVPLRRDLVAASLGAALPQAFTLEQVAPGVGRIRVAGQRLHDWFAMDPRGVPLSALFDDASRPALGQALDLLFARPALVEIPVATARRAFRTPITGRLLLLPLRSEDGRVTRAVGAFGFDLPPTATERRFGIPAGIASRIESILPRARTGHDGTGLLPSGGPADYPPPLAPARPTELAERGRPWLRLVVSNDRA